jgi:hypothetical protein
VSVRPKRLRSWAWGQFKIVVLALGIGAAVWLTMGLTRHATFSITSKITSSPVCSATVLLYPGVQRCLTYTVTNPNPFSITFTSLGIARVTSSAPTACSISNLDLSKTTFSGSLTVRGTGTSATSEPIEMLANGKQDLCEGVTFRFAYRVALNYRTA